MIKKSDSKRKQGYNDMPIPRTCGNCAEYESEFVDLSPPYQQYMKEKNKRCGLGGFEVKKTATCNEWRKA